MVCVYRRRKRMSLSKLFPDTGAARTGWSPWLFCSSSSGSGQNRSIELCYLLGNFTEADSGNGSAQDSEYLEKVTSGKLRFALFVVGILPVFAERLGAPFDFIPAQSHAASLIPQVSCRSYSPRIRTWQAGCAYRPNLRLLSRP